MSVTEFARQFAEQHRPPMVDPGKARPARYSRQKRSEQAKDRANRDTEYLVLKDFYLAENPYCVLCGKPASQIHHVVRGIAGKPRSLLNTDTWLGACDSVCHDKIEKMTPEQQIQLKQQAVKDTILRLRK